MGSYESYQTKLRDCIRCGSAGDGTKDCTPTDRHGYCKLVDGGFQKTDATIKNASNFNTLFGDGNVCMGSSNSPLAGNRRSSWAPVPIGNLAGDKMYACWINFNKDDAVRECIKEVAKDGNAALNAESCDSFPLATSYTTM